MSEQAFFTAEARARVVAAIKDVEARTAAELVVTLRRASGHYRHTDYLAGAALAFAVLLVLLFHPREFPVALMPLEVAVGFAAGAFGCAHLWTVRRALTATSLRETNVARAARAAFVDGGVTRTTGRTGVLVYLSLFERYVEVVTDVGIAPSALGAPWKDAVASLRAAAAAADLERFVAALHALGPVLGTALPRAADDVNELPDEVHSDA